MRARRSFISRFNHFDFVTNPRAIRLRFDWTVLALWSAAMLVRVFLVNIVTLSSWSIGKVVSL